MPRFSHALTHHRSRSPLYHLESQLLCSKALASAYNHQQAVSDAAVDRQNTDNTTSRISRVKSVLPTWIEDLRPSFPGAEIAVLYNGLCHSDLHVIQEHWGPCQFPKVPGHEVRAVPGRSHSTPSSPAQIAHTRYTHSSSISHDWLLQIVGKVTKRGSSVKHLKEGDLVGECTVCKPAHALPEHPCPAAAVCICSLRMLTAWRCAGIGWYKSCCLECNACVSGDDVSTCQADRAAVVSLALRLASCMHNRHCSVAAMACVMQWTVSPPQSAIHTHRADHAAELLS